MVWRPVEGVWHRPCGACRALVPENTGCEHWKVRTREAHDKRREAHDKRRAAAKAAPKKPRSRSTRGGGTAPTVEEFQRIMQRGYR